MSAPTHRPALVNDAIFVDEIGIEIGIYRDFRLKSAYQPIFKREPATLRPVAVEGLIAPFLEGRPVATAAFFDEVLPEDRLFVESMCRALHLRNHRNIGVPWLELFFNYDPRVNFDLEKSLGEMHVMARQLQEIELDPTLLICEITEAAALDQETLLELMSEMRRHGIRIAVDDFGSGHSTFERVGLFKPDIVKIDGAWFRRLCEDESTARLFGPIAATFRHLGSKVLVEGIETAAQLRVAVEGKVDLLQGFLLARPALAGTIFEEAPVPMDRLFDAEAKIVPLFGKHQRR